MQFLLSVLYLIFTCIIYAMLCVLRPGLVIFTELKN